MFSHLQQREIFHLTFLRQFVRRVKIGSYALKGGSNLRFFYKSIRYSEDMDLDIKDIEVFQLKDIVMEILGSKMLVTTLRPFQIDNIASPDIKRAKQTETVQRFKVHLITASGEDLFTKIEFSRRSLEMGNKQEPISAEILYDYRQPPLIISHYPIDMAIRQKILALADRAKPQARDVFDIFMLYPQIEKNDLGKIKQKIAGKKLKEAEEVLFGLSYETYRDTVCSYLADQDRKYYDKREIWEEMQIKIADIISG